jgi:hypothetical protein
MELVIWIIFFYSLWLYFKWINYQDSVESHRKSLNAMTKWDNDKSVKVQKKYYDQNVLESYHENFNAVDRFILELFQITDKGGK